MNEELVKKAKEAKSVEELLALAGENGIGLTEEQAKAYFAQLHPAAGELDDDELDAVAGGGCGGGDGNSMKCPVCGTEILYNKQKGIYFCSGNCPALFDYARNN